MATAILGAKQSPRFEDNVLRWYDGDTFDIDWDISLVSVDDEGRDTEYAFMPGDKIVFEFFDARLQKVKRFEFTESNMVTDEGNAKVTVRFDAETTAKFKVGSYTYCIKVITENGNKVTTIGANNKAVVERCH